MLTKLTSYRKTRVLSDKLACLGLPLRRLHSELVNWPLRQWRDGWPNAIYIALILAALTTSQMVEQSRVTRCKCDFAVNFLAERRGREQLEDLGFKCGRLAVWWEPRPGKNCKGIGVQSARRPLFVVQILVWAWLQVVIFFEMKLVSSLVLLMWWLLLVVVLKRLLKMAWLSLKRVEVLKHRGVPTHRVHYMGSRLWSFCWLLQSRKHVNGWWEACRLQMKKLVWLKYVLKVVKSLFVWWVPSILRMSFWRRSPKILVGNGILRLWMRARMLCLKRIVPNQNLLAGGSQERPWGLETCHFERAQRFERVQSSKRSTRALQGFGRKRGTRDFELRESQLWEFTLARQGPESEKLE